MFGRQIRESQIRRIHVLSVFAFGDRSVVDVREVAHVVNKLPNVLIAKLLLCGHGRSGHAAANALEEFLSFGSAPKLA